ncbi:NAC domain containing protein 50-like [Andrographis paniculata]|uniref:NAC domain containing protein 50-like n=1 Tax=Andrographis paniculata TaxID=175694 RepID=UPI0021E93446|nr:NAC domain containing protein 50-like [Andrographis paniculata]
MEQEAGMAMGATSLAPGFRFHPTDEELVRYYLTRKACGKPFRFEAVTEIDVYKSEPWELAEYSSLKSRDLEWYFFSPVDRKYGNGSRLNRATGQGYWKATGKDRTVYHKNQTIGMKKTLVFHSGRAPEGKRTNWVMHEYRLCDYELQISGVPQDSFVLCRIFQKSGLGPPNGDRYAPFVEEEWNEDALVVVPGGDVEDDFANVDEERVDLDQDTPPLSMAPPGSENAPGPSIHPFTCKRERSEDNPDPSAASKTKKSKPENPNVNGSEESTTTTTTTNFSPALLEFPLSEPLDSKETQPATNTVSFDSSNLEKSVPPGYLKFIGNLESEILNVSMERETLKIEVMRAQAMINILQSRIDELTKERDEFRKRD